MSQTHPRQAAGPARGAPTPSGQSPIFDKTQILLTWLLPHTARFPRAERFRMKQRLEETAFEFHELITRAARLDARRYLLEADVRLNQLRLHVRLCLELQLISFKQYEHAASILTEIGRLLGAWMKKVENLYNAYRAARRGKRDRAEVAAFSYYLEDELFALQDELRAFSYTPGSYYSFAVHEPKRRLISAAPFRDRVVHHALVRVIEPLFERRFIFDSYANRVGKGTHAALDRFTHFARRFRYVLPCDARQFFPSVDHAILRGRLARVIHDERALWLCDRILESGIGVLSEEYTMVYFPGDDLFAINRPRGLPIGNLTSQFWANVYLDPLDQFIKRRLGCKGYLRYVDDQALFSDDKRELAGWCAAVVEQAAALRLTIHEERAQPRPVSEGTPFLGFQVFPDHRRLNSRRGHYARRHLRALAAEVAAGRLPLARLSAGVRGWAAHAAHGDTYGLRRAVFSGVRV